MMEYHPPTLQVFDSPWHVDPLVGLWCQNQLWRFGVSLSGTVQIAVNAP